MVLNPAFPVSRNAVYEFVYNQGNCTAAQHRMSVLLHIILRRGTIYWRGV
jgi:hypothetical protein